MKIRERASTLLAVGVLAGGTSMVAGTGVASASLCDPIGFLPFGGGNHCVYDTPAGTHVDCTVTVAVGGWGRGCAFTGADGVVWGCNEGGFLPAVNVVACPNWLP